MKFDLTEFPGFLRNFGLVLLAGGVLHGAFELWSASVYMCDNRRVCGGRTFFYSEAMIMSPFAWFAVVSVTVLAIIYFWALYTGRLEKPDE